MAGRGTERGHTGRVGGRDRGRRDKSRKTLKDWGRKIRKESVKERGKER